MFYCNKCKEENNWPESISKSMGRCEICGDNNALCNDVPSSRLPEKEKPQLEMRDAKDIYKDAQKEVLDSGNYGLETMAIIGIEKAQKEMFYYIYELAEAENENGRLIDFFDKLDGELIFNAE